MYIHAKVTAGAKREGVTKKDDTHYAIMVREEALQNRANMRVRELLARVYTVPVGKVQIVSGHRSPSKIINIEQ